MKIYRVGQITAHLRELLECDPVLGDLWVSGEVSNLSRSTAGHLYFTLKDQNSQLRCVMFRRLGNGVPMENGTAVIVHGYVSLYEVSGQLQFYVDLVQPEGVGTLHLQFELLRSRLEQEGLFDLARKRPLPPFPRRIGVVTSPTGAVIQDIIHIINRRCPSVELVLSPTLVQGEAAATSIVAALQALNREPDIDLVIIARGGGSLEDLWPFNQEAVARAIFASRAPVISGIGHETDVTIADLVADLRAPTPSAAAELAVPHRAELLEQLAALQRHLNDGLSRQLRDQHHHWRHLWLRLQHQTPDVSSSRQRLEGLIRHLSIHLRNRIQLYQERVQGRLDRLTALSPGRTLARGYALVQHVPLQALVTSVRQVHRGDQLCVQVHDGAFDAQVTSPDRVEERPGG